MAFQAWPLLSLTLRRCVDLQRVTVRRSRSGGFPTPPASLHLSAWTLACSDARPVRMVSHPSLGTAHGLSLALEDLCCGPGRGSRPVYDHRPFVASILPWDWSPLRRSQSEESTSRLGSPALAFARAFQLRLVAGSHTRFGPPSPFSTTLTVCSSSDPVICFNHSRPWGSFSRLPLRPPRRPQSEDRFFRGVAGPGAFE
jgi:hypothetical protein